MTKEFYKRLQIEVAKENMSGWRRLFARSLIDAGAKQAAAQHYTSLYKILSKCGYQVGQVSRTPDLPNSTNGSIEIPHATLRSLKSPGAFDQLLADFNARKYRGQRGLGKKGEKILKKALKRY